MAFPGLKRGIIQLFIASFEDFLCTCRREEVVGERSLCRPCSIPYAVQKRVVSTIHPPFYSSLSSNTACMSKRRN